LRRALLLPHFPYTTLFRSVFVGADSGPAHLAAAAGANVLVLFSGTNDPRQWRPWGDRVRVLQHSVSCAPCNLRRCPLADHPCLRARKSTRLNSSHLGISYA